jgi:hypothetical protein
MYTAYLVQGIKMFQKAIFLLFIWYYILLWIMVFKLLLYIRTLTIIFLSKVYALYHPLRDGFLF